MKTDFIRLADKPALEAEKPPSAEKRKLAEASAQFEAVLLSQMFDAMQKTAHFDDDDGEGGGSSAPYADLLPTQMAQSLASAGGLGLASWLDSQVQRPGSPASASGSTQPGIARLAALQTRLAPNFAPAPNADPAAGALLNPIEGAISSPFGEVRHRADGSIHVHQGIDVPAPLGTPIRAAAAGRVVFSGQRQGYGETVEVEHPDGSTTRYAHCSRRLVEAGQSVKRGQTIAEVGSTGRSTGPHLHFEVLLHGKALDPLQALGIKNKGGSV
jgi:murein DD-endopeptidase MepM/ murein hydrolase activator NlpD